MKISELPAVTAVTDDAVMVANVSNVTSRTALETVKDFIHSRTPQFRRNLFTEAKQNRQEAGATEAGYTGGVWRTGVDMTTTTTYQKLIAVPFVGKVAVRAWGLNSKTSIITLPQGSVSFSSGVQYDQDFPTTDGSTPNSWVLDRMPITIPAAATDENQDYTGVTYTRTAGSGYTPGVVSLTVTGHGWRDGLLIFVSNATDPDLNGFRQIYVVDANTVAFPNPENSTAGGTLRAQAQSGEQGIWFSNWQMVDILPNIDGGELNYLYCRMYPSVALNGMQFRTDLLADDTNVPRLKERMNIKTGSNFLLEETGTMAGSTGQVMPCNIQILGPQQCITVGIMGDSTSAGAGTTSGLMGWNQIAVDALSTFARPVVTNSIAWAGQTAQRYIGRTIAYLDNEWLRPDILIIQPAGQNKTGSGWDEIPAGWAWAQTLMLMAKCQQVGTIPVLRTCTPSADLSVEADVRRKEYNARIREAASTYGLPIIDFVDLITTEGSPDIITPAYAESDAHLNNAGHQLVAPVVEAVLAQLIGNGT